VEWQIKARIEIEAAIYKFFQFFLGIKSEAASAGK
jgi:hypothetical protein